MWMNEIKTKTKQTKNSRHIQIDYAFYSSI